jgi:capsular polysaccharide biosynthesis protein
MNTLTAPSAVANTTTPSWVANALRAITPGSWQRSAKQPAVPVGAAMLLARADAYEPTQPGFAADLRATAQRIIDAE